MQMASAAQIADRGTIRVENMGQLLLVGKQIENCYLRDHGACPRGAITGQLPNCDVRTFSPWWSGRAKLAPTRIGRIRARVSSPSVIAPRGQAPWSRDAQSARRARRRTHRRAGAARPGL